MSSLWAVSVSKLSFSPVGEIFFLLEFPGDLPSIVSLALSRPLWTSCPDPAHDHQPESPSTSAPAVSLSG